jgi:hypothetical protein
MKKINPSKSPHKQRFTWEIKPASKPHSSKKGKKGYKRNKIVERED